MRSFPVPDRLKALAGHDAALAGALAVVLTVLGLAVGHSAEAAIGAGLLCAPLFWRSRWPLEVLFVIAAGSVAYVGLVDATPAFAPALAVALYAVAVTGSRWRTVAVASALAPSAVLIVALFDPDTGPVWRQSLELITQLGIALAVGEAVRSGRALLAAMRERTELVRQDSERDAQRRVDEERIRIARDVHDIVSHSLATISTQASVGLHVGRRAPEQGVELLESIKQLSNEALLELRQALGTLRDDSAAAPTDPMPSLRDVPTLVEQARGSGLPVVLRMEGSLMHLPATLEVAAYRVVQEGLTNVMRHAQGAKATVRVAVDPHQVEVDVTDDGNGTPSASGGEHGGSGLVGMQERVGALGGSLAAGPSGAGFAVHAILPRERLTT